MVPMANGPKLPPGFGRGIDLRLSRSAGRWQRLGTLLGHGLLLLVASSSTVAVLFIVYFIARDAVPFFRAQGIKEFFTSTAWYPTLEPSKFGSLAIFFGSGIVTLVATVVAVPLGVAAAVCLSDVLPFRVRQYVKPVVEVLAAIPSVAYGFFALVIFAPLLQKHGGTMLSVGAWMVGLPLAALVVVVASDVASDKIREGRRWTVRLVVAVMLGAAAVAGLYWLGASLGHVEISSGTNALNVGIILGIMALPTVVSVSEDALTAAGRELREGSYALGATRAETILKVVIPAARSGIFAAIILGVMRAVGETMVVWMASGNAAKIPSPWWDVTRPVRTLTATIAGDMGETAVGSPHYHCLFAMALCLLVFCLACNLVSEWVIRRAHRRLGR